MSKTVNFNMNWELYNEPITIEIKFTLGSPQTYDHPGDAGEMEVLSGHFNSKGCEDLDEKQIQELSDDGKLFEAASDLADEEYHSGFDDGDMAYDLAKGN